MQQSADKLRTHLGVTPPHPLSPGVRLAQCNTTLPVISSHKLRGPQGVVGVREIQVVLFSKTQVRPLAFMSANSISHVVGGLALFLSF